MTTNPISWQSCIDSLKNGLARPRDHVSAWRDFEPSLAYGRHHGPPSSTARLAAVTVLVYPVENAPYLALTRRHEQLRSHGGQISFPGGSIEAGETPTAAALRELQEELGVPSTNLTVAGELSPIFIFNSNFVVTPVVVLADHLPTIVIQDAEVAQLLQTPLAALLSPSARGMHLVCRGPAIIEAPHLAVAENQIWGATCMILAEFLSLLHPATLN